MEEWDWGIMLIYFGGGGWKSGADYELEQGKRKGAGPGFHENPRRGVGGVGGKG
jgi:hypothetical protein